MNLVRKTFDSRTMKVICPNFNSQKGTVSSLSDIVEIIDDQRNVQNTKLLLLYMLFRESLEIMKWIFNEAIVTCLVTATNCYSSITKSKVEMLVVRCDSNVLNV